VKGLDTNVLVRFLVKDDPLQAARAVSFVRATCSVDSPCHVNRIVLCELEWVLESAYGYPRSTVAEVIGRILRTAEFLIEDADEAWAALRAFREHGADFSDCLLGQTNLARGCESTATFDRRAGRVAGFELLEAAPRSSR
jgi:predicted nucleic-acid-binding protein